MGNWNLRIWALPKGPLRSLWDRLRYHGSQQRCAGVRSCSVHLPHRGCGLRGVRSEPCPSVRFASLSPTDRSHGVFLRPSDVTILSGTSQLFVARQIVKQCQQVVDFEEVGVSINVFNVNITVCIIETSVEAVEESRTLVVLII